MKKIILFLVFVMALHVSNMIVSGNMAVLEDKNRDPSERIYFDDKGLIHSVSDYMFWKGATPRGLQAFIDIYALAQNKTVKAVVNENVSGTPLFCAMLACRNDLFKVLVKKFPVNIDRKEHGHTYIVWARIFENEAIAEFLIKHKKKKSALYKESRGLKKQSTLKKYRLSRSVLYTSCMNIKR